MGRPSAACPPEAVYLERSSWNRSFCPIPLILDPVASPVTLRNATLAVALLVRTSSDGREEWTDRVGRFHFRRLSLLLTPLRSKRLTCWYEQSIYRDRLMVDFLFVFPWQLSRARRSNLWVEKRVASLRKILRPYRGRKGAALIHREVFCPRKCSRR